MAATTEKKEKKNLFSGIGRYFLETKSEMKKVSWPTRKKLMNNTIVVITMLVLVALLVFLLDKGFEWGFRELQNFLSA